MAKIAWDTVAEMNTSNTDPEIAEMSNSSADPDSGSYLSPENTHTLNILK